MSDVAQDTLEPLSRRVHLLFVILADAKRLLGCWMTVLTMGELGAILTSSPHAKTTEAAQANSRSFSWVVG